jgi:hypothetical protein
MLRPQAPNRIYIWIGRRCPTDVAKTARYQATLLLKYEHVQLLHAAQAAGGAQGGGEPPIVEVHQGSEPPQLVALLDPPPLDAEAARVNARRHSIAEELASGSSSCNPASSVDAMDIVPGDAAPGGMGAFAGMPGAGMVILPGDTAALLQVSPAVLWV